MTPDEAPADGPAIHERIERWAVDVIGPQARVVDVAPMPGNSGISFGFRVTSPGSTERFVIRLPHPRARRQGSSDVLRQVEVLRAAEAGGVPVPAVRWAAEDNAWFGVPFYVVDWVDGESTGLFDARRAPRHDGSGLEVVFADAMAVLARIHAVDWQASLPHWTARSAADEVDAWVPTLRKSSNAAWIDQGLEVRDALLEACPSGGDLALVHGDYYSNNWLFGGGRVRAVVDWEIAGIAMPGLDVGWVCMIYDPESWGPLRHRWDAWSPEPDWLVAEYESASGRPVTDLAWYRALAGYRLGCISARAYDLHRSGKSVDPAWDVVGESFPRLMGRAAELLGSPG